MFRTVYILTLVFLVSCSSANDTSSHTFRIYEENGVTIAENSGGPKYHQPLFEIIEAIRLVQDESRQETLLYSVNDYRLADDGMFYVLDAGYRHIAVYDRDGNYLMTFGKRGSGPGEFEAPKLKWIQDGYLVVSDRTLNRLSLWTTDGNLVSIFSNPTTISRISDMYLTMDQQLIIKTRDARRDASGASENRYIATVLTPEGDTLGTVESASNYLPPPIQTSVGVLVIAGRGKYFGPLSDIDYYPNLGILYHDSADSDLKWYGLDGELKRVVRLGIESEPVTNEDRGRVLRMLQDRIDSSEDPRAITMGKARKNQATFSEYKAIWGDVYVDDLGYYWLKDLRQYYEEEEQQLVDGYKILCPDGEYLGCVNLPKNLLSICQGYVLTREDNEDTGGNDYVVYKLHPLISGIEYP